MYPREAAKRGVEGWACLEFTVTSEGEVENVEVLAVRPSGFSFGRAAAKSVLKWKYKPKMKDGHPVDRPGVRLVINFNL